MVTLAQDRPRDYAGGIPGEFVDLPVIASDIIFEGAAVGESASTGTVRPLVSGDQFKGMADRKVDNSLGAASAKSVRLRTRGRVIIPVTLGDAIDNVGDNVYVTDDNTWTITKAVDLIFFGTIVRFISGTNCEVEFNAKIQVGAKIALDAGSSATAVNLIITALEDHGIVIPN